MTTSLAPENFPAHIAVIMDGNGRWATARGLPRLAGHYQGAENLREILTACGEWGIRYLTVYAFSTENWRRDRQEVDGLMTLMTDYLHRESGNLQKNRVRLLAMGDLTRLPANARATLSATIDRLQHNDGCALILALSYGGRDEIKRAAQKIAGEVAAGKLTAADLTEETVSRNLDLPDVPDPDLLIRTAGEKRLSNFLLWQASYAELYFTEACFPDFSRAHLAAAIADYQARKRKFGGDAEERR
ncbi:isoprenyl transferase [Planctomycetales bacterium]|nr:isoprenyl transferase [Planctomycetales bacterium]